MLTMKTSQRSIPISIATSNAKKAAYVAAELAAYGIGAVHRPIHLVECQSDSVVQIARSKATQAYEQYGGHLIVEDSGFYIPTLRGFPGPYAAYIVETIGISGILKLMESVESDRSACFVSCLVYVDSHGDHHLFQDDASLHEISRTISSAPLSDGWSDLWRVLIPEGENVPYPDLEEVRRAAWKKRRAEHSVFQKFSRWLHSDYLHYSN